MSDRIFNLSLEDTFLVRALASAVRELASYRDGPSPGDSAIRSALTKILSHADEKIQAAVFEEVRDDQSVHGRSIAAREQRHALALSNATTRSDVDRLKSILWKTAEIIDEAVEGLEAQPDVAERLNCQAVVCRKEVNIIPDWERMA